MCMNFQDLERHTFPSVSSVYDTRKVGALWVSFQNTCNGGASDWVAGEGGEE